MSIAHILLTLMVILIWGLNFIFVKLGIGEFTPLWLCAIRFVFASIPAVFFIKPPHISQYRVAAYGLFMFALQFAMVFISMTVGMTPGMASLIMQVQVFFTLFLGAVLFGEKPSIGQLLGAVVAFIGIAIVAGHLNGEVTFIGFMCVLGAAASWAIGNLLAKTMKGVNMMAVVVWGSLYASVPTLLAALYFEGTQALAFTTAHLSIVGIGSVAYIIYASTWVGYGIWNWLLNRYPVGMVIPFTLLIPVVGFIGSSLVFGEVLQTWKVASALLVISGLGINILSTKFFSARSAMKLASKA